MCRVFVLGLIYIPAVCHAGDWPSFRGPDRSGRTHQTAAPITWGPSENIKWKVPLPGEGNSSPVIAGNKIFLTCANEHGTKRGTYCFDRTNGKLLWQQVVDYTSEDPTHGTNPYCGSSPAVAEGRIVVWHGSAGVYCYDLDGKQLWSRDLGVFRHIWGYGSSPVIYRDRVFLNCGPGPRQFVTALDLATGKTLWQQDEPGGNAGDEKGASAKDWTGSWSTPIVIVVDGRDQVLVTLARHVQAYDPQTGDLLWSIDGMGPLAYTDPLVEQGIGVAMSGYHGPAIGFKLGGSGDMTEKNRLWHDTSKNPQRIGSGVLIDGYLYMANEIGLVQCIDAKTGKEVWKDRLPGGKIWASLIEVDGRLYVTNQKGTTYVIAANPEKFELLAENRLDDGGNSTLAVADGQILLRTFGHLYCIE
jgi:outer membrane protein assembly factor BamB